MAEPKQLSDSQAQIAALLQALRATAGPRGATYAGRVITPQDTPQSIMARTPAGDVEEFGQLIGPAAGAVGAGITKAQLKAGLRPIEQEFAAMEGPAARGITGAGQRISKAELQQGVRGIQHLAEIAKKGDVPLTPVHKLLPAAINETTGEVAHAMTPGPFLHEPLLKSIKGSVRGWVDPATWKAYTDEMLSKLRLY